MVLLLELDLLLLLGGRLSLQERFLSGARVRRTAAGRVETGDRRERGALVETTENHRCLFKG